MPKNETIEKILVIGSGPIIIGQAAEFDYSGTQACHALKEEGYTVVLANSNPATIMTDETVADHIYMEPLTLEFMTKIIRKERPDAVLPTLGGQTGLNMAVELDEAGVLDQYQVALLGSSLEAIEKAEDRDKFRTLMDELNEPVPPSEIVTDVESAVRFVESIDYPVIVRPAFTLGGTGGGMCDNERQLRHIVRNGLALSPAGQCLIEKSITGFKELEYEVIRDKNDQAIVVCDMENIDPVGVHTGDSMVIAPSVTLSNEASELLRTVSLRLIRALGIEGGCNVQLALHPESLDYYIIEVNPRVSRSSALASKATSYPIAKVAAKIAVGLTLDEITNPMTEKSSAYFEPSLHYFVVKIPRFPFDKFTAGDRRLGTQMKATGEIMAIGHNIEEALLKGVRSLEIGNGDLYLPYLTREEETSLLSRIKQPDDERIFVIAELFRRGITIEEIHELTKMNEVFLRRFYHIIELEEKMQATGLEQAMTKKVKKYGFSDQQIARVCRVEEQTVYDFRMKASIVPVYQQVNTLPEKIESTANYFYSTYETENESESLRSNQKKVLVLGSGPIRIGQGIEFDYATVHSVLSIKEMGYEAIIMNNNPETVSTDFSISDKLYFEPITLEDVMHVVHLEEPIGVIVQFGGQTAINLAEGLEARGVNILGTSLDAIDRSEDRHKFEELLEELNLIRPLGKTVTDKGNVLTTAEHIGFPVLVRPSYVIGGSQMELVHDTEELNNYLAKIDTINPDRPLLIDQYVTGIEVDVDAVSDGQTTLVPGIMEHIERAGVHSGDSIAVYPPQRLSVAVKQKCLDATDKIAKELNVVGLINIQFIIQEDTVYVIEVNPRASRTIPFLSKVTGVTMANAATKCILGEQLSQKGYHTEILPEGDQVYVKLPVFSFEKLRSVDTTLGPEMKSTGEAIGYDKTLEKALYKGFAASGLTIPFEGSVLFTVADKDKHEASLLAARFEEIGFELYGTKGTAAYMLDQGLSIDAVGKIEAEDDNLLSLIKSGKVQFVINTLTSGKQPRSDGFRIRRESVEHGIISLTSLDTAEAILNMIESTTFSVRAISTKGASSDE